jgi:sugar/nucleoside kinase (ribokinase family)
MLTMGNTVEEAVKMAVVASGISVTRRGAAGSIPTKAEIDAAYAVWERETV